MANKLAYLGQAVIPVSMFKIISKLCGLKYPRWVSILLICSAVLMFALVCTTGHLDWYYKSADIKGNFGSYYLVKEYGVLHPANLIYVVTYFLAMLAVIGISFGKNKRASQKIATMMLIVVLGNIGMWIVEKILSIKFSLLSISYLTSEFVFFFTYYVLDDYIHVSEIPASAKTLEESVNNSIDISEKINIVLSILPEGEHLTQREKEILELILCNKKRKDIAEELHLSENTVKTYTRSLYLKLGVGNREEIYALLNK